MTYMSFSYILVNHDMAYLKVKNRFVYLHRQRKLGLMTAVLNAEEQLEVLSIGEDPKSELMTIFRWKARKFLTLLLDKDERLFAEDFEKIDLWGEEAKRELTHIVLDWCQISGRFNVWDFRSPREKWLSKMNVQHVRGFPLGDTFTLSDRNLPHRLMKILFGRTVIPKVQFRLDTNDVVCITGTLDNLIIQFAGSLMTLTRDQVTCMMCPEPNVRSFRGRMPQGQADT